MIVVHSGEFPGLATVVVLVRWGSGVEEDVAEVGAQAVGELVVSRARSSSAAARSRSLTLVLVIARRGCRRLGRRECCR